MLPTGLKLYLGIAFAAIAAAVVGGYTSGGDVVGPISAGYKGGIGDHVSYVIFAGVAFVSVVVGGLLTFFRDSDPESVASSLGLEAAPVGQRPTAPSVWPFVAGTGFGAALVGLAVSPLLFQFGLAVLAIVAFEWTMTAWADRATGDVETNVALRDQLMKPFEVPLLGFLGGGVIVLAVSRILLATTETGAVVVGSVVAVIVLAIAVLMTQQPNLSKNLLTGIVAVVMVGVLAGGIWGAVEGTREIEHHEEEHSEEGAHSDEGHDDESAESEGAS